MLVIDEQNVNGAYETSWHYFQTAPRLPSRFGDMIEIPEPVATVYRSPSEKVLFDPVRDANPFFHFFESLWMLGGRKDVERVSYYLPSIADFSDDGIEFHGAYGFRWRHHFGVDQLKKIVEKFLKNPHDRRLVLTMWDPEADLGFEGVDFPCNTHAYLRIRDDRLHMTVCNRSNDAIWGCYGANAVHFAFLLEYLAGKIGVRVGTYTQVSNSLHIYPHLPVAQRFLEKPPSSVDHYRRMVPAVIPFGSREAMEDFDRDLTLWNLEDSPSLRSSAHYRTLFFQSVVAPMEKTFLHVKEKDWESALRVINEFSGADRYPFWDWHFAAREWLKRRIERKNHVA